MANRLAGKISDWVIRIRLPIWHHTTYCTSTGVLGFPQAPSSVLLLTPISLPKYGKYVAFWFWSDIQTLMGNRESNSLCVTTLTSTVITLHWQDPWDQWLMYWWYLKEWGITHYRGFPESHLPLLCCSWAATSREDEPTLPIDAIYHCHPG